MPTPRPSAPPAAKKTAPPVSATASVSVATPVPTKKPAEPITKSYRDEKGNVTKMESYDADGNLDMTIYYEYDTLGNPVKIRVYDKNGKPMED